MTPKRYRKKPEPPVEAVQWTGENGEEVEAFAGFHLIFTDDGRGIRMWCGVANPGDYIYRDSDGSRRFLPAASFQATYEEVADGEGEKTGAELIAAERERQVSEEDWTPEHDDQHDVGELATAAACYAEERWPDGERIPSNWPFEDEAWKPAPDQAETHEPRIRELTKAGALIAAEIDRLQRAALTQHTKSEGGSK